MKSFKSNGVEFVELSLGALYVGEIQREASTNQIAKIVANFNWQFFNAPVVAKNSDGRYRVVDGQHGVAAARQLYGNDCKVVCRVTPLKDYLAFLGCNTIKTAVSNNVRFWVNLKGGEPTHTAINEICNNHGITLQSKGHPAINATRAVAQLLRLWGELGGKHDFRHVISMLSNCFRRPEGEDMECDALSALFIEGLATFYKGNEHPQCDVEYALRRSKVSAAEIVKYAKQHAGSNSTRHLKVAECLNQVVAKYAK